MCTDPKQHLHCPDFTSAAVTPMSRTKLSTRTVARTQSKAAVSPLARAMHRIHVRGDDNFVYALYRLDNVMCEFDRIALSRTARIRKIATITSPIGKALIGQGSIERSKELRGHAWNQVRPRSGNVYSSFAIDTGFGGLRTMPMVFPAHADCVVECSFEAGGPAHSNDRLLHYMDELRTVMTALRLLTDTAIHGIGPVAVRFHPQMPGGCYEGGSLEDEVLGVRRIPPTASMEVSHSTAKVLKALFTRLSTPPLPNEWSSAACSRLQVAHGRSNSVDQIVDCAIGLESIFGGSAAEIRFRCAALLGRDAVSRSNIAKDVGDFFRCRNRVVHGSSSETLKLVKENTRFADDIKMLDFARSVLRRARLALAQAPEITRDAFRLKCDDAILAGRRVIL